jgi:uncharacterized membrane protein
MIPYLDAIGNVLRYQSKIGALNNCVGSIVTFIELEFAVIFSTLRITGWQWSVAESPVRVDAVAGNIFMIL